MQINGAISFRVFFNQVLADALRTLTENRVFCFSVFAKSKVDIWIFVSLYSISQFKQKPEELHLLIGFATCLCLPIIFPIISV